MSAVLTSDSDDLEALFDSIAAEHKNAQAAKAAAQSGAIAMATEAIEAPAAAPSGDGVLLTKLGQLTRTLHESLRELGYDRLVERLDPDDRDRERPPRRRVPGGRERWLQGNHEALQPNGADPHHRSIADHAPRPGRGPAAIL